MIQGDVVTTIAGRGANGVINPVGSANGDGTAASFGKVLDLATDGLGNIYISDTYAFFVRKLSPSR